MALEQALTLAQTLRLSPALLQSMEILQMTTFLLLSVQSIEELETTSVNEYFKSLDLYATLTSDL